MITDKINFRQPKYMLPLIIYLPLLGAGYFIFDLFDTELAEVPTQMQTTEYLNPELPEAQIRNDGIGGRYESMVKSYGRIQDYSAVENIERDDNNENKEYYDSKYSEDDLALLDAEAAQRMEELERLREMQERLRQSAEKGESMKDSAMVTPLTEEERIALGKAREKEALAALDKALAEARLQGRKGLENVNESAKDLALKDSATTGSVIKGKVEINDMVVPKGAYLYAIMSGFGSQRVKGSIKSVLVGDELVKVNLSLYDTDGLEGLYVPSSQFRETTKDVAGGAMTGSVNMNTGTGGNSFTQWGMQAIQNAYQKTTNALSKAVKKNRVKLKYGTFVYLVNGREKKEK